MVLGIGVQHMAAYGVLWPKPPTSMMFNCVSVTFSLG